MEPGGFLSARAMSLMDSPAFHLSHSSFLRASGNPGRPSLATSTPPVRTTQKTLPCCTDRLNPPRLQLVRIKMDLILCTESPKSGLTKSADGSIARRTWSRCARPQGGRHVGLDKMCLLMEVRIRH